MRIRDHPPLIANKYIYESTTALTLASDGLSLCAQLGPGGRYKLKPARLGRGQLSTRSKEARVKDQDWITPKARLAVRQRRGAWAGVKAEEADRSSSLWVGHYCCHAGTWYAQNERGSCPLSLDFFGGYSGCYWKASPRWKGGFEAAQNTITFTAGRQLVTATKTGYILEHPLTVRTGCSMKNRCKAVRRHHGNEAYKAALSS